MTKQEFDAVMERYAAPVCECGDRMGYNAAGNLVCQVCESVAGINLEQFAEMVRRHDVYFAYSDDHREFVKGTHERRRIRAAARKFDRAEVNEIYRANGWRTE